MCNTKIKRDKVIFSKLINSLKEIHAPNSKAREFLKYIGPGILVTVGFTDPGNWAANIYAGSYFGYSLLWVVTLSTIMLIVLQHNVAHLGIVTGLCLSEAATKYLSPLKSRFVLSTAVLASIATSLAEILGGAIAINILTGLPIKLASILVTGFSVWLLFTNSYRKLEKWIIGFVSLIGFSFLFELCLVKVNWIQSSIGWVSPEIPHGALPIVMSVLGAVVMPHNLFLHSEIIQSRQWNLESEEIINKQLKYEFYDTLFSMIIGWAINSAMIILAATAFFVNNIKVEELQQAQKILEPMLGPASAIIFAAALLFSGLSSTTTSGMAGGSIFAGIFNEPFDIKDKHTKIGVFITFFFALIAIFLIKDPFWGLIVSQIILSIQLPWTICLQVYLTSSKEVMGAHANGGFLKILLIIIAAIVIFLNILLLINTFHPIF